MASRTTILRRSVLRRDEHPARRASACAVVHSHSPPSFACVPSGNSAPPAPPSLARSRLAGSHSLLPSPVSLMALLGRSTALPLLLLLALVCIAAVSVHAAESESLAAASTEAAAGTEAATEASAVAAAEASWKPRSYPRTNNVNRAPARHRFFLPNPCVLNDERTGAQFDLTPLRKTGSVVIAGTGAASKRSTRRREGRCSSPVADWWRRTRG